MFRQYIPGKWQKCGVKLYTLCEPSAYVWNAVVERKIGFSIWTSDTLIACDEANGKVTGLWPHPLCRQFLYQFSTVSRTTQKAYTALWHSTAKSKTLARGSCISKAENWTTHRSPEWTYGRHEVERQKGRNDAVNSPHREHD